MTRGLAPADAVVVGGGLVAASLALELARRDLTVDLLFNLKILTLKVNHSDRLHSEFLCKANKKLNCFI